MMKTYHKLALLLLAVLIISAFASCTTNKVDSSISDIHDSGVKFLPEYVNLPEEVANVRTPILLEKIIYFFQTDSSVLNLYQVNIDGSILQKLDKYKPRVDTQDISALSPLSDGTAWIAENGENGCFLRKIMLSDGSVLNDIDLTYLGKKTNVFSVAVDLNGNVAAAIANSDRELKIYAFSADSEALFEVGTENGSIRLESLLTLHDGRMAAAVTDLQTNALRILPIDIASEQLGADIGGFQIYANKVAVSSIGLLVQTDAGIVGYAAGDSEPSEFVNWLDSDMSTTGLELLGTNNGNIIMLKTDYSSEDKRSSYSVVILSKGSASDGRITLELGCLYLDYRLRDVIVKFNQTDPDYRIEATEYAPGYPEVNLDLDAAMMKLNIDLIAGNIPDILFLDEKMPFSAYSARGLFEDLTPYLNAEPEYKLVKAAETAMKSADGKLYRISPAFDIITYIGDSEVVGDELGWTFKDVDSVLSLNTEKQLYPDSATQNSVLDAIIRFNLPDYINWSTGDVSIDSPDFIKLLERAKLYSPGGYFTIMNTSVVEYYDSELLGINEKFSSISDLIIYNAILEDRISFKGYPCETRQGSTLTGFRTPLAMSAKSANKDGAWRFMRNILTQEYYRPQGSISDGFPTTQAAFDSEVKLAMTENYDERSIIFCDFNEGIGGGIGYGYEGDDLITSGKLLPKGKIYINGETEKQIDFYAMTDTQLEHFMEFINSITRTADYDQTLADIVIEETISFFAGDKTAEDAARIIQSRIMIYVNEQR